MRARMPSWGQRPEASLFNMQTFTNPMFRMALGLYSQLCLVSTAILFNCIREQISHLASRLLRKQVPSAWGSRWSLVVYWILKQTSKDSSSPQPYHLFLPLKVISSVGISNFWVCLEFCRANTSFSLVPSSAGLRFQCYLLPKVSQCSTSHFPSFKGLSLLQSLFLFS